MKPEEQSLRERAFGMLKIKKITERLVHKQVAAYLRNQYPKVRFLTTLDGEFFSEHQAQHVRALQHSRGVPDLLIFAPRNKYIGLAIEIKRAYHDAFKKNGKLRKSEHLDEQKEWLYYLTSVGWAAQFGCGFEDCKKLIDNYLKIKL